MTRTLDDTLYELIKLRLQKKGAKMILNDVKIQEIKDNLKNA